MVLERLRKILESGDFTRLAEVYRRDAFFEVNIPAWRFQRQGTEAIIGQFQSWYGEKGAPRFTRWVERSTESGALVELEQLVGTGDEELYYRYVNLFVLDGDMVAEHVIYCPGPWDKEARARCVAEERLVGA